jgi:presenilin-like A22 family membrane protease
MKHKVSVTIILVILFLAAQLIGLTVVNQYYKTDLPEDEQKVLPLGIERPEVEEEFSYIPLLIAIVIATGLALLLINLGAQKLWKVWFFVATFYLLSIAFAAFFNDIIAFIIALALVLLRTFRLSVISHNFVELFVYSGIPAIFAPILSITSVSILLIVIAIYDMIAVWKTKHMVKLAKFQTKSKVFAGLFIPYMKGKKAAILGGGDVGFPMLFAGVVFLNYGWLSAIITSVVTSIALLILLLMSKKNKFYPAMPFIGAGCFVGFFISLLV